MPPARRVTSPLVGLMGLLVSRATHLIIGGLAVAFIVFAGIDATKPRPHDGTVWLLGRPDLAVLEVPARNAGSTTPLRPGDEILGIANRLVSSPQEAADQLKRQRAGTAVNYLIRRDGEQLSVTVPLLPTRVVDRSYLVNVLLTTVYLLIGFLVYWRSNNERPARLFFLLCLTFGMYFMTNLEQSSYFWGDIITQNLGAFARFMLPAIFLQFFLVFPEKKRFLTRHPFLSPLVYFLPLAFYIRFTLDQFIGDQGAKISTTQWLVMGIYYVFGLAALMHGYFSYRDPLLRERVRILTFGTLAAVLPFLVFKIGLEELTDYAALAQLGIVPLLAIPISFGYCVARYQVLQIDQLLKRSLLFNLMSGVVLLAYLGIVFWIGGLAIRLSETTSPLVSVGATLAIAAVLWPLRNRLQAALDRQFYRTRSQIAEVLEEFSKEIPRLIQRDALLQRVGGRLCDLLEVERMGFYAPAAGHAPGTWELTARVDRASIQQAARRSPGDNAGEPAAVGEGGDDSDGDGEVVRHRRRRPFGGNLADVRCPELLDITVTARTIARRNEPFWVDLSRTEDTGRRQAITREQAELATALAEQRLLAQSGIALLVPMATGGRLIALMALPSKSGGEEYQLHEIRLLTIVAGQMALQTDNARLLQEEVAKQKLEEEMQLARDIQSRLLPARIPTFNGVDIHAVNISSKQVSGDYYDMIEREDGKLAMVIADVSGKGMPASLLASNLQAALRAQCATGASPSTVLLRINKQMHEATDPQHFATLFLCVFDPTCRRLVYSSGGHNAPVVVRDDRSIEMLDKGGLPLGAFDFGTYEEGQVDLHCGDLLFMYTDGLTETKDLDATEEYGEERLNQLLLRHRDESMSDLFTKIDGEINEFRGRNDADDDITLIGMKITAEFEASDETPAATSAAESAAEAGNP